METTLEWDKIKESIKKEHEVGGYYYNKKDARPRKHCPKCGSYCTKGGTCKNIKCRSLTTTRSNKK